MRRRDFLRLAAGAAGAAAIGGCGSGGSDSGGFVSPSGPEVAAAAARRPAGTARTFRLQAVTGTVDLGGPKVPTWSYGGELPGPAIRVRRGETVEATIRNNLPVETSIHWHGIALRNDMDGMPGVTQPAIAPGADFTYRFAVEAPGTYFFHPHSGLQLDRGLYAPLIVEDPDEPGTYDDEWVVVLDDWLDGVGGKTPDAIATDLRSMTMDHESGQGSGESASSMPGMSMPGMSSMPGMGMGDTTEDTMGSAKGSPMPQPEAGEMLMGARSDALGGDAGDVAYPYYLVNGRVPTAPRVLRGKPKDRVRMRLINAGGDTAFRVALGGHKLRVTHSDGYPVEPVVVDTLLIGMGERYDVEIDLADGVFPLVALAEGKTGGGLAVVRTGTGTDPASDARPKELRGTLLRLDQLRPRASVALPPRTIDREHRLELRGSMDGYTWTINGDPFDASDPLPVAEGERVRLTFVNTTTMWHPMHLHGHTFQINTSGPRKDTVPVLPDQMVTADFDADNPGLWMVHCHNVYHLEAGMMRTLAYRR